MAFQIDVTWVGSKPPQPLTHEIQIVGSKNIPIGVKSPGMFPFMHAHMNVYISVFCSWFKL